MLPTLPPVPSDGTALLHNLLDRAIVIGTSGLEFLSSGEVVGKVDEFKGRLDANPRDGKFRLYGEGVHSLSPLLDQFQVRYEGDPKLRRGEYVILIHSCDANKIVLEIKPKP